MIIILQAFYMLPAKCPWTLSPAQAPAVPSRCPSVILSTFLFTSLIPDHLLKSEIWISSLTGLNIAAGSLLFGSTSTPLMTWTQHTFQSHAPSYVLSSLTCQLLFWPQASPASPLSSPWTYSIVAFMLQVKPLPSLGLYFLTFVCLNRMELPRWSSNAACTQGPLLLGRHHTAALSGPTALGSHTSWHTHQVSSYCYYLQLCFFHQTVSIPRLGVVVVVKYP